MKEKMTIDTGIIEEFSTCDDVYTYPLDLDRTGEDSEYNVCSLDQIAEQVDGWSFHTCNSGAF